MSKRITENTASPKLVDNYVDEAKYNELYKESVENNEAFWAKEAQRVSWHKDFTEVKDVSFDKKDLH